MELSPALHIGLCPKQLLVLLCGAVGLNSPTHCCQRGVVSLHGHERGC